MAKKPKQSSNFIHILTTIPLLLSDTFNQYKKIPARLDQLARRLRRFNKPNGGIIVAPIARTATARRRLSVNATDAASTLNALAFAANRNRQPGWVWSTEQDTTCFSDSAFETYLSNLDVSNTAQDAAYFLSIAWNCYPVGDIKPTNFDSYSFANLDLRLLELLSAELSNQQRNLIHREIIEFTELTRIVSKTWVLERLEDFIKNLPKRNRTKPPKQPDPYKRIVKLDKVLKIHHKSSKL